MSPSGSATGQRTTGNGGQRREPTGKRFGSTKPNGNCRERLRRTCHGEGRGFESLHPAFLKGPGNGAFALPDANTDSRSATGAATGTPRGSEHRPLRCRSCRSSTDRVRRGHNQGSRRDLCRAYPSGGTPGCGTTSAAPPAAGTPCNANRQQHFQQAAVAAYSILSNRWSEWALGPKSYDGYPLQRAIQASQQLYLDISAAATTRAPRRTGSRWW